jgi:hypothetical protein
MTIKKFATGVLSSIAIISGLAASGIRESADWWVNTKPFFYICIISTAIAVLINNFNYVRRIIYPTFVCISAWLYKHGIVMTKFTRDTYRVYKHNSKSFKKLFGFTQDLFDAMYM